MPSARRDQRIAVSQNKPKLLIIEDDPGLQKQLRWSFDAYDVVVADDRESALAQIRRHEPAVVTMDLGLPPDPDGSTEGLATLQQILALAPETKVIVVTGNEERAHAVRAIALGAYDFHQKPCDPEVLNLVIHRAFFLHELQQENRRMQQQQAEYQRQLELQQAAVQYQNLMTQQQQQPLVPQQTSFGSNNPWLQSGGQQQQQHQTVKPASLLLQHTFHPSCTYFTRCNRPVGDSHEHQLAAMNMNLKGQRGLSQSGGHAHETSDSVCQHPCT